MYVHILKVCLYLIILCRFNEKICNFCLAPTSDISNELFFNVVEITRIDSGNYSKQLFYRELLPPRHVYTSKDRIQPKVKKWWRLGFSFVEWKTLLNAVADISTAAVPRNVFALKDLFVLTDLFVVSNINALFCVISWGRLFCSLYPIVHYNRCRYKRFWLYLLALVPKIVEANVTTPLSSHLIKRMPSFFSKAKSQVPLARFLNS